MKHERHTFDLRRRLLYFFTGNIYLDDAQKEPVHEEIDFLFRVEMSVSRAEYQENWALVRRVPKESYKYFLFFLECGCDINSAYKLVMHLDKLEWETTFHAAEIIKALPTLRLIVNEFETAINNENKS